MNEIQVFNFESNTVRTVIDHETGKSLFVGKDVCIVLGYSNHNDAMSKHCRGVAKRYPIVDSLGRTQEVRVLTEADVLRLIISSNMPAAQRFEKWVFEEVLPAISKTGQYAVATQQPVVIGQRYPEDVLEGYMKACNVFSIPVHMAQVEAVKHVRMACGVDYSNLLKIAPAQQNLAIEDVYLEPTELGKKLGYTAMKMNLVLCNLGLQEKTASGWEPTAAGKQICTIHQWANGSKSGVNLKWKLSAVRAMAEAAKD